MRRVKIRLARIDSQSPLFDQEAQNLLAEKWIARSALGHLADKRIGREIDAEP